MTLLYGSTREPRVRLASEFDEPPAPLTHCDGPMCAAGDLRLAPEDRCSCACADCAALARALPPYQTTTTTDAKETAP